MADAGSRWEKFLRWIERFEALRSLASWIWENRKSVIWGAALLQPGFYAFLSGVTDLPIRDKLLIGAALLLSTCMVFVLTYQVWHDVELEKRTKRLVDEIAPIDNPAPSLPLQKPGDSAGSASPIISRPIRPQPEDRIFVEIHPRHLINFARNTSRFMRTGGWRRTLASGCV